MLTLTVSTIVALAGAWSGLHQLFACCCQVDSGFLLLSGWSVWYE